MKKDKAEQIENQNKQESLNKQKEAEKKLQLEETLLKQADKDQML